MSDVSKIQMNGEILNIKDSTARASIATLNASVSTARASIATLNASVSTLINKEIIFIGDSYGLGANPDGDNFTSWIDIVGSKLGSTFYKTAEGGAGFLNNGEGGNTFLTLLRNLDNTITNNSTITDIVVCGGYNDRYYSESQIVSAISTFTAYCNANFPNATVHIGFIGWSKNSAINGSLYNAIIAYQKGCYSNNVRYLIGCEYTLHDYFSMFTSDSIHPNENGQEALARNIAEAFINGSVDVHHIAKGCGVTMATNGNILELINFHVLISCIHNNLATIYTTNTLTISVNNVSIGQANGNFNFEIGTFTDGYLIGTTNNIINIPVSMVVQNAGIYYACVGNLMIMNGKIYVSCTIMKADGTGYVDLSAVRYIQINRFTATVESLLV